jgi:hypothetical protein
MRALPLIGLVSAAAWMAFAASPSAPDQRNVDIRHTDQAFLPPVFQNNLTDHNFLLRRQNVF